MKGRNALSSVGRLCRLHSKSREGGIAVGRYIPQLRRQVCSGSSSSSDDSLIDPSCTCGELSKKRLSDKVLSSSFAHLQSSTSTPPLGTCLTSLPYPPHVGFLRFSPVYSLCSSVLIPNGLIRVSAVPFATLREKCQEDKQEVEVEGHEKQGSSELWSHRQRKTQMVDTAVGASPEKPSMRDTQEVEVEGHEKQGSSELWSHRQRKTQMVDTAVGASPEKPSMRDTVSESEVSIGNEKAINESEVELSSARDEAGREVGWSAMGWNREEVLNVPNAISLARLFCGPLLSWMILHELWSPAFVGLVIAGISDWLDGYVARKLHINSVLGSYLDPVADKFLVGSVAISMAYTGLLHPALVGLIVARDGVLMGGAFFYRAYSLHWKLNDWKEFFRISIGGVQKVEPLFISKVNTVLQLALVGVALLQPALSLDDTYSIVPVLSWSVVVTTSISWAAYAYIYWKNPASLAALRNVSNAPGPRARG